MISHRNVISNVLQISAFEKLHRDARQKPGSKYSVTEVVLGLLPQSHIYALVVICHASTYRGDQVINLPRFEMGSFLNAIQRFEINTLFLVSPQSADDTRICVFAWLILEPFASAEPSVPLSANELQADWSSFEQVPPIIIGMAKNKPLLDKFDLSSVQSIFTGAAPLGKETAEELQSQYPGWAIRQGYGK